MANVRVSKFSDFNGKKFLVVDDFPEFRTAIKRMVEAFGGKDIDTTSNGEDAVAKIKSKKYDVIMCDYNLGDGKDGQQVLEEGKFLKHIKESQIFILLTAENTAEMVMGALEYEPDGYLVKPFTKEMVHDRLMKSVIKKQELLDVLQLIESEQIDKALKLCDQKIAVGGKVAIPCLKIKAKQLAAMQRYDDAFDVYNSILESKEINWALMGAGQCLFYKKDYEQAINYFKRILAISEVNVEAYDWIAKALIATEQYIEAQEVLEKAIRLSSKAILRQQHLGDLAFANQSFVVAEKAYRSAVMLGRYSCYRRPHDYYRYACMLYNRAKNDEHGRSSLKAGQEAVHSLETMLNLYNNDAEVSASGNAIMSLVMGVLERKDKSKMYAKKAIELIEREHLEMNAEKTQQVIDALLECGDKELAEKANKLKESLPKNTDKSS